MDDERGLRIARRVAAILAGIGAFMLFMSLFLLAGVVCHGAAGCSHAVPLLTYGAALSSLVAALLIAGGRYALTAAALGLAAALSVPLIPLPFVIVLLALLTPWWDRL